MPAQDGFSLLAEWYLESEWAHTFVASFLASGWDYFRYKLPVSDDKVYETKKERDDYL